jgi:hypothetical protein
VSVDVTEVLVRLAVDDPLTWSNEGLDDGCFWCGADPVAIWEPEYHRGAIHDSACAWVAARRLLGLPLGEGHAVAPDEEAA